MKHNKNGINYPRSKLVSDLITSNSYYKVAQAADFGHHGYDNYSVPIVNGISVGHSCINTNEYIDSVNNFHEISISTNTVNSVGTIRKDGKIDINYYRRLSKSIIERDRNLFAEECNYSTWLTVCHPVDCTPKNDVLIGIPNKNKTNLEKFLQWCQ